jgi:2-polyprenyl-3-methyl-5-hydroxy-6-metoxy-1,4-benzoquinol methylase
LVTVNRALTLCLDVIPARLEHKPKQIWVCKLPSRARLRLKSAGFVPLAAASDRVYNQNVMAPSDAPHRYAIRGGKEGKIRLDLLARVMLPTSMELLDRAGLRTGMKCLDVGCGGGHVTISMARVVGPEGHVIGTDTDAEVLALAREDAEATKGINVKFEPLDACACAWHEEFDLAYARFVLSHLNEPENCLAAMLEACGPGGTIVIEDTDFAGSFCYPTCGAYQRYVELYQELVKRRGGDANIGPKLPAMLRRAGIEGVELNVIQPAHIRGEGKLMAPLTMSRISGALTAEGLATESEAQQILIELNQAAADSETVISLPRIFQVWGKRAV